MKASVFYFIGSILLFLGLSWMLLPHAFHSQILQENAEEQIEHSLHTLQGVIVAVSGLGMMLLSERYREKNKKEKNKTMR